MRGQGAKSVRSGQKSLTRVWQQLLLASLAAAIVAGAQAQQPGGGVSRPPQDRISLPKNTLLPITLPFQTWNGLAVVQGQVNTTALPFVVSTGLNAVTVSTEGYKNLQLTALPSRVHVDFMDSATETNEIAFKTLTFGSLQLSNTRAALLDMSAVLSRSPQPGAPMAWLGTSFLSAFQVTFDFAANRIVLDSPQAALPSGPDTVVVPITIKDGRVWVKVALPGAKPYSALIDTGTGGTLIPTDAAFRMKIKPIQVVTITRPDGRQASVGLAMLAKIGVGKAETSNIQAAFLAPSAPAEFDHTFAILGTDFLRRFKVTINFAKKKMAFAPLLPISNATASDESVSH